MPINKKHITYDLFSVTQRLVDSMNKHEEENNECTSRFVLTY